MSCYSSQFEAFDFSDPFRESLYLNNMLQYANCCIGPIGYRSGICNRISPAQETLARAAQNINFDPYFPGFYP